MKTRKEKADLTPAMQNEKSAKSNNHDNSNSKPTQCQLILEYMEEHGSITSLEAVMNLGCMRLASRISELKKRGYYIVTEMEKNALSDGYHAKYRLGGDE